MCRPCERLKAQDGSSMCRSGSYGVKPRPERVLACWVTHPRGCSSVLAATCEGMISLLASALIVCARFHASAQETRALVLMQHHVLKILAVHCISSAFLQIWVNFQTCTEHVSAQIFCLVVW